jgi:hypothetical protein
LAKLFDGAIEIGLQHLDRLQHSAQRQLAFGSKQFPSPHLVSGTT